MKFMKYKHAIAAFLCLALAGIPCAQGYAGTWSLADGQWKNTEADGHVNTGWYSEGENDWYFLGQDGNMRTGWQDGFHLHDSSDGTLGRMDTGWYNDGTNWYFLNTKHEGAFGQRLNGWQWVDGYCYYFADDGKMYENTTTPDGYLVNQSGRWVLDGIEQYVAGQGFSSIVVNGNITNNTNITINNNPTLVIGGRSSGGGGGGGGGSSSGGGGGGGGSSRGSSRRTAATATPTPTPTATPTPTPKADDKASPSNASSTSSTKTPTVTPGSADTVTPPPVPPTVTPTADEDDMQIDSSQLDIPDWAQYGKVVVKGNQIAFWTWNSVIWDGEKYHPLYVYYFDESGEIYRYTSYTTLSNELHANQVCYELRNRYNDEGKNAYGLTKGEAEYHYCGDVLVVEYSESLRETHNCQTYDQVINTLCEENKWELVFLDEDDMQIDSSKLDIPDWAQYGKVVVKGNQIAFWTTGSNIRIWKNGGEEKYHPIAVYDFDESGKIYRYIAYSTLSSEQRAKTICYELRNFYNEEGKNGYGYAKGEAKYHYCGDVLVVEYPESLRKTLNCQTYDQVINNLCKEIGWELVLLDEDGKETPVTPAPTEDATKDKEEKLNLYSAVPSQSNSTYQESTGTTNHNELWSDTIRFANGDGSYREYYSGGKYTRLTASIAPDSGYSSGAHSAFTVYGDDNLLARYILDYTSDPIDMDVDISGYKYITLLHHSEFYESRKAPIQMRDAFFLYDPNAAGNAADDAGDYMNLYFTTPAHAYGTYTTGAESTNHGDLWSEVIRFTAGSNNYREYYTGGKYSSFVASIAPYYKYTDKSGAQSVFRVFGDDKELASYTLDYTTDPFEIDVDISGYNYIKLTCDSIHSNISNNSEIILQDAYFR